ncbi:MAG: histidine phosphatase family protein [Alphaproteobacteria bacterium]
MFTEPFYFIRHGVTDYNRSRLVMGQIDIPLNEEGRMQARRAVFHLAGRGIASIYASPLSRALETATILGDALGVSVTVLDDLRERNWGVYEGRDRSLRPLSADPEGGETLEAFTRRTLNAIRMASGPVSYLFVAHNGTCRVLRRLFGLHTAEELVPNAVPLYFHPQWNGHDWQEQSLSPAPPSPQSRHGQIDSRDCDEDTTRV